ncbi:hypothetical protein MBLNU459_g5872t1 [Dothideomycetes sp. NU459]
MCYYDQHIFVCGDWKWGHFRQHCSKEYRTGETCGLRFIFGSNGLHEKCKLCIQIEAKQRKRADSVAKIRRWQKEGGKPASIQKHQEDIVDLDRAIYQLEAERARKKNSLGRVR